MMIVPSLLAMFGLSWSDTLFLLAIWLVLGGPWLLAAWALWRLRGARSAGGLGRAYLLANYSAAVQLSNLRGEQALIVLRFIVQFQCVYMWGTFCLLIFWRSVPLGVLLASMIGVIWLTYRYVGPAVDQRFRAWGTAAVHDAYSLPQRRTWGLLGHGYFAGSFTFVFIGIILREYFS